MNICSPGAENSSAPTTAETLQAAHEEIAVLQGSHGSIVEALEILFGEVKDLKAQIEKLEES